MKFHFSSQAEKQLDKLDRQIRLRIFDKVEWFESQSNPIGYAERLENKAPLTHRFRVGKWRLTGIWLENDQVFLVSEIGSRGQIYKQK
jgi:mRNA-degrading endonuclease RelE of RelBE toxin-antitoxin system